jgi:MULE transposase domain
MVIQVGLVFIRQEREVDYNWALEFLRDIMAKELIQEPVSIVTDREIALIKALRTHFPSSRYLLCRWHVNMNVLAKTKKFFPGPVKVGDRVVRHPQFQDFLRSWNMLLDSPTESIYNQRLAEMQANQPTGAVKYCTDTWLIWKENLIAAWINRQPHFGVVVTSPVEGCHATLKGYLQRGHGDLRGVYNRLKLFWEAQHESIKSTVAQQQLRPRHSVNIPLFSAVLQHVHAYALRLILRERAKLPTKGKAPSPYCNCSIEESMGLPCYHKIWKRQQEIGVIQLEDIHPHWYVIRPESGTYSGPTTLHPLPILNPLPVQGRGRPRGALGGVVRSTNTRREPSSFEIPSSSAPPTVNRSQEPLYIVNSGLVRLENGHQDLYEPGTERERAYMRGLSSIYQTDSMVDAATAAGVAVEGDVIDVIEVDVGN